MAAKKQKRGAVKNQKPTAQRRLEDFSDEARIGLARDIEKQFTTRVLHERLGDVLDRFMEERVEDITEDRIFEYGVRLEMDTQKRLLEAILREGRKTAGGEHDITWLKGVLLCAYADVESLDLEQAEENFKDHVVDGWDD